MSLAEDNNESIFLRVLLNKHLLIIDMLIRSSMTG
jgi:hypothetical protein